ncbi:MAG: hypothetical protein AAFY15_13015, partial [Cyanobacteria bacterium J06648_11]
MSDSSSDRFIYIQFSTYAQQHALLDGLDALLRLGLVHHGQLDLHSRIDDLAERPSTLRLDLTLPPNEELWAGVRAWQERKLL